MDLQLGNGIILELEPGPDWLLINVRGVGRIGYLEFEETGQGTYITYPHGVRVEVEAD